jgi:hypothetical protein
MAHAAEAVDTQIDADAILPQGNIVALSLLQA